jgi:hypothetical protein
MVEMLLRHGKSSSQVLDTCRSWRRVLDTTWENRDFQVSVWNSLEVVKLFLEYGASPETKCFMPDGTYSAMLIIETALKAHHPPDEDEIRALLTRHLPSFADASLANPFREASRARLDIEQEITQERVKQSRVSIRKRFLLWTSKKAIGNG